MALEGVAALMGQLQQLGALEDGKAVRAAVRAGIKPAVSKAKATAPVGTVPHRSYKGRTLTPGFLQRSVRTISTLSRDKQKASALLGVRREAFYGTQFLELGTSKMAKRPWLRPAFESTKAAQLETLKESLRLSVLRAAVRSQYVRGLRGADLFNAVKDSV